MYPDQTRTKLPGRREFLKTAGITTLALPAVWSSPAAVAAPSPKSASETAVKALHDSLTPEQRKAVVFDWNHIDPKRGLLRTHICQNWQITDKPILSDFYTKKQQGIIYDIFKGLINPDWLERYLKQVKDDSDGEPWGAQLSIALFGNPGDGKFEFVITGRHLTLRADGNSEEHVAFGGPIIYGHKPKDAEEAPDHPGNVFWPQAVQANKVYKLLDDKQRKRALLPKSPEESAIAFRGKDAEFPGLPVSELTGDVRKELQLVLSMLVEPFRTEDRDEVLAALKAQGGLDATRLSFFSEEDLGNDGVWDNWRLEGPSFVWYFRGSPHVHVWVNVADDAKVKLNSRNRRAKS